jgi:chromosome segregation ATPase
LTHIVFNEGTTAVVGPNGCGRRIADAAWVVGERSASRSMPIEWRVIFMPEPKPAT